MADVGPNKSATGRVRKTARLSLAFRVHAALWLLVVTAAAFAAADDASVVLERRVKAALLYRFLNYVEWQEPMQPAANAPFIIAVVGADPLAAELAEFAASRSVQNHPLFVRSLRATEPVRDAHVVFIGRGETASLSAIARSAPNALIVTEADDGVTQGAVINFRLVDGQVRFDVSLDAARRRGLRLSARLLSVAHAVQGAAP
jgi:hypothetical protein